MKSICVMAIVATACSAQGDVTPNGNSSSSSSSVSSTSSGDEDAGPSVGGGDATSGGGGGQAGSGGASMHYDWQEPVALASDIGDDPRLIACDGGFLYWIDAVGGAVRRVGLDGSAISVLLSSGASTKAVLDQAHVYYLLAGGEVHRVPKAGGTDESVARVTNGFALASNGAGAWIATNATIQMLNGPVSISAQITSSFAVDALYVYWIDAVTGEVQRSGVDGTNRKSLGSFTGRVGTLASAGHNLFLGGLVGLQRMLDEGGAIETITGANVSSFTTDVDMTAWVQNGKLRAIYQDRPAASIGDDRMVGGVAACGGRVYWTVGRGIESQVFSAAPLP